MKPDTVYFRTRAQEEFSAAAAACSTSARNAHVELAHRYGDLAEALQQCDPQFQRPVADPRVPMA